MSWLRFSKRPLGVQFWIAGGIVGFFSVASLFLLLSQVRRQTEASRWLAQTHRTISRLSTLGRDFYQHRTLLRGHLESAEPRKLEQAKDRRPQWDRTFESLRESVEAYPDARPHLEAAGRAYEAWQRHAFAAPGGASERALETEARLFQEAWASIEALIDRFNRQLSVRDLDEKSAIQHTFAAIALINITLLLAFGVALINLYQSIARPIAGLSVGIRRYMSGDFRARVAVGRTPEIGYVGSSFNELAARIESMVSDLRRLDEMKSDFLSTVSHELRTPLTSIGGYVKLLLSGDAGALSSTQTEFLNIVDTNVGRLGHLINDLLDVEKIESGKIQLIREPQDLSEILRECRDSMAILAKQKGLEFRFTVPEQPVFAMGDRVRLIQVFMNLLSNAIKYTRKGYVELSLERRDFAVMIRVRDSGEGLSPEDQEQLFQKFYRSRRALESAESGTGLGLVIVKGLVEAHGGTVAVESGLGEGTVFTVSLPLEGLAEVIAANAGAEGRVIEEAGLRPRERVVWHVGGDAESGRRVRALLAAPELDEGGRRLGAESFSGASTLPRATSWEESPLLVILDGAAVNRESVAESARRAGAGTPILVLGDSEETAQVFAWGATALLKKPIKPARFSATVSDLLRMRGRRILLADPDPDVRLLLKRALEQRGYVVEDVDRGNLALARLERERYDLLILERELPDVSGVEVLRAARRLPQHALLKVLVLDDAGASSEQREFEALGVERVVATYQGIDPVVEAASRLLANGKA
ncbi:MAG: response regulator [Bdellovibrionales bacterium]|nr:response regulator [Bdellovibrionales bacterium]